ncbi:magnesium transporter CorA family protein [Lentzea sp. BCCO 10_0856]|uniref:Magnesium transporter CorA family protein n=1 Tax=Lentzea miocenica TaxID=3095431 RepID=A0ABU4T0G2_9PSEU|nr:magnesium transporter CorA family protein [Lentzea sp. BCCO 10_0856]MDX8031656.1 magnesium transporter CorA family protein [Lentzea sp. BCCO 10_0856]
MGRTRLYRNGELVDRDFPVSDVARHLEDPSAVVWFDLCAPSEAEIGLLRDELGLHELAIEDATAERQRPKVDRYPTHLFLSVYAVSYGDHEIRTCEVDVFVTKNALVTVRENESYGLAGMQRRWDAAPTLAGSGVGFLLHGLLDDVADSHYAAAQRLDDDIEALEDRIYEEKPHVGRKALRQRRALVQLRRVALPMREVLGSLVHREHGVVDDVMMPYYLDVKDHALFTAELTESMRELVTNLREAEVAVQSNRLNSIMKKVTSWAAIIAVPTAISGYYGMNVPYPGYEQRWGFWVSTLGIFVLSYSLYFLFKRRDWL